MEKENAQDEEVEVAETVYRMFDLKNTNSLAENIIRHFDFSTIGFLDDDEESSSFLSPLILA